MIKPGEKKTLSVGVYDYTVYADAAKHGKYQAKNKTSVYASTDHSEQEVILDPEMHPSVAAVSLLHELLHVCVNASGLEDCDGEERLVHSIAPHLLEALRRNSWLVKEILG